MSKNKVLIQQSQDLDNLFDALGWEIVKAHDYHKLYCGLNSAVEYELEFQQSNTFWVLTNAALRDAALLHLCRIYDQDSKALSLKELLQNIQNHSKFFSKESFNKRLASNANISWLAEADRMPDLSGLEQKY